MWSASVHNKLPPQANESSSYVVSGKWSRNRKTSSRFAFATIEMALFSTLTGPLPMDDVLCGPP